MVQQILMVGERADEWFDHFCMIYEVPWHKVENCINNDIDLISNLYSPPSNDFACGEIFSINTMNNMVNVFDFMVYNSEKLIIVVMALYWF